jgi:hypothetical protein
MIVRHSPKACGSDESPKLIAEATKYLEETLSKQRLMLEKHLKFA